MLLFVPRETTPLESRVALVPAQIGKLRALGLSIVIEAGAGVAAGYVDAAYVKAGATVATDRAAALGSAQLVVRVRRCPADEAALLAKGAWHISFFDPASDGPTLAALTAGGVTGCSMDLLPRSTIAQRMDALSSQASLAGYAAVLYGATKLRRILPMMMTPAGTLGPGRVFVIGAGVAGLQAIATAKRLGARVEAFDTRPAVEEQVRSLGGKFVKIDLGETGQTAQGYAKELTPEQLAKQRAAMAKVCAQSDLVITTAKVFGRRAPIILTKEMVAAMAPGSVVVDLATEAGGNTEGIVPGAETLTDNGVLLVGAGALERQVAADASLMFGSNLTALLEHLWDKDAKALKYDPAEEITKGIVVCRDGAIVHERFRPKA